MRKTIIAIFALLSILTTNLVLTVGEAAGQGGTSRTSSKMLYHNGPVLTGVQDVYFIFYGCWGSCTYGDPLAVPVLTDLVSTIGNTPYAQINSTYADGTGHPATGSLVVAGYSFDASYSHGADLTESDVQGIIENQVASFQLPQDPNGIYVVATSSDIASTSTGFCTIGAPPFHGSGVIYGTRLNYILLGNPERCPAAAALGYLAPNGTRLATPNGNFQGDAMATNLAHALNASLTDPHHDAWFDRYGLENADKCALSFGSTYTTGNGARANIRLGSRDFLLEQNWVNDRKGRCAMYQ